MTESEQKQVKPTVTPPAKKKVAKRRTVKRKPATISAKTNIKVEMKKVDPNLVLDEGQNAYLAMDMADDAIALAKAKGEMDKYKDVLVYCFQDSKGNVVMDLSIVGYDELSYQFRKDKKLNLSQEDLKYTVDPTDKDYVIFEVKVKDLISGACSIGVKRQWTKLEVTNWVDNKPNGKKVIANAFWFEQGKTKAYRNGMKSLMPRGWIDQQVKLYVAAGKYANIGAKGEFKSSQQKAVNSGQGIDEKKIANAVKAVEMSKTKGDLERIDKKVIQQQGWTGQEKYKVRELIKAKMAKL